MRISDWSSDVCSSDLIRADEPLMGIVRETGRALFGDNCMACHGANATGGPGYPNLTDGAWLWGGDPETIAETIRVGINSGSADTRISQMMAFGRDQMIDREGILNVVAYVQSLSQTPPADMEAGAIEAGKEVYADNCAVCHGDGGRGSVEMGAPDLTDDFWIYGGDRQSIYRTVYQGRQGHMPHWEGRLSELDRKILTLYLLDLGEAGK